MDARLAAAGLLNSSINIQGPDLRPGFASTPVNLRADGQDHAYRALTGLRVSLTDSGARAVGHSLTTEYSLANECIRRRLPKVLPSLGAKATSDNGTQFARSPKTRLGGSHHRTNAQSKLTAL